ncbi:MAG: hypothetical protein ACO2OW_02700 [Minisyncoccia bacterium]|jgi:cell division protein FtsA
MTEKVLGIDLGSKILKLCLGEVEATGEPKLLTTLSKEISSFKNGEIINEEDFLNEVIFFINNFLQSLPHKDISVVVSFSSSTFNFQKVRPKSLVESKTIEESDIRKCKHLGRTSLISSSQEIIYEEISKFYLDGSQTPIRNPLGLEARYLEIDMSVIQIFSGFFIKLEKVFEENKIKVNFFLPNPLGASLVILDSKSKESGSLILDFGFNTLSSAYFYQGSLTSFNVFSFGLENLLNDFLSESSLTFEDLENFFNEFRQNPNKKTFIKLGKTKISFQSFQKILEKKLSNLFKKNNFFDYFNKLKSQFPLLGGVYIIGGALIFPHLNEVLKKILKINVKEGKDLKGELKEEYFIFLNSWGNIFYFLKSPEEKSFFKEIFDGIKRFFSNLLPF